MKWAHAREYMVRSYLSYAKICVAGLLIVITVTSLFLIWGRSAHQGTMKVSFLDVGQGDAILVQTPSGHDMLIDGGVSDIVLQKLFSKMGYFDHHLDVVLSTHPDADHVTGLIPVLKQYDVDRIVVSPSQGDTELYTEVMNRMKEEGADLHIAKEGDVITFGDGVTARVLYPDLSWSAYGDTDTNSASVSVLLTFGDQSVLLTGDLPSQYEKKLVHAGLPQAVTIYKAGHHGSKYSSSDYLLSYIQPTYVVISAGKNNKYGHPHSETIERLQRYTRTIVSTATSGTITFSLDGKNSNISTDK